MKKVAEKKETSTKETQKNSNPFETYGNPFLQMWIDNLEFWHYATVAKFNKPEWVTPNEIVGDLHCFKMRKFTTKDTEAVPTLILPPFAGHYSTIADFSEEQSLVRHLMSYGVENLYCLDYHSATGHMKDYDIDNYLAELNIMIDDLGDKVNLIGLCQGGWFAALFTARFPQKVRTLVLAGSPIDTHAGEGYLENMVEKSPEFFFSNLVNLGGGLMDGKYMLQGFKHMNPWQHYFKKYMDIRDKVRGPVNDEEGLEKYENFEIWYENTLKLPGIWYKQVIEELFRNNNFMKGKFKALGRIISPKAINCPVFLLAGEKDDITLPEQVYHAKKYFGTAPKDFAEALSDGGHIGLFMGKTTLQKHWKEIAKWMLAQKYDPVNSNEFQLA